MLDNPLQALIDGRILGRFFGHYGLMGPSGPHPTFGKSPASVDPPVGQGTTSARGDDSGGPALRDVAAAFACLPYENLTKIIKRHEQHAASRSRRPPGEVLADHIAHGTGGTCFSLTATLLSIVRSLGFQAEPLLADRRYGENTHCALLVWIDGRPHLLDPGYLICDPVPLDTAGQQRITTEFNELLLVPQPGGRRLELSTIDAGRPTYRLTFKTSPADPGEFLKAWDASFDWDMMRYPLLSCVRGHRQLYLRGGHFQRRARGTVQREEIPGDQTVQRIVGEFGIDARLVAQALEILRRQGERDG